MSRVTLLAVVLLLLSRQSLADESLCDTPEHARQALFDAPWPEIDRPGGATRVKLGARQEFKEMDLLEYFVSGPGKVPSIESKPGYGSQDPSFRTTLSRTWTFPGLTIEAVIDNESNVIPMVIALESADYPLVCGLRVGATLEEFRKRLGEPMKTEQLGTRTQITYFSKIDDVLRIQVSSEGRVEKIVWDMARC